MYAKSQILIDRYDEMQTETDDRSTYIETGAFITGVAALLVFLALAVIAAAVITFQVNRPLQVLAQATTEAQTGQYAPEKAGGLSGRKDEIGQLARGFAKMVAALGDREAGLKQQVEELRQKLENSQM
ncbi:MAG: HAMP domain-containing protein [Chloroflexota bacterium]|nr:MAG: HAMP domain-containing protein [Chloroflexota bacterium]